MVQRNLKKLLFLMVLMLSVGQAAQATRVYADLAKVTNGNSHGVWNLETKTFTWDAPQNRRILLTGLPDFSEFEYLVLDIQSATGAFRVDFEIPNFDDDNTASYLPGTQFDVTEEAKLLQIPLSELTLTSEQLSSITGVRINANSTQGEVVLNGVYLERDFELVFDEMGKAYIYPSDMTVTGEGMTLDSQTGILTKNAEGAASLTVEFGDVDFSNVTHIDVDVDRTTSPYIDLLAQTMEGTTETGNGHTELKNQLLQIPGVMINKEDGRVYPLGEETAHLVGYVQAINSEELEANSGKGYTTNSVIGKSGLEKAYEDTLRKHHQLRNAL